MIKNMLIQNKEQTIFIESSAISGVNIIEQCGTVFMYGKFVELKSPRFLVMIYLHNAQSGISFTYYESMEKAKRCYDHIISIKNNELGDNGITARNIMTIP